MSVEKRPVRLAGRTLERMQRRYQHVAELQGRAAQHLTGGAAGVLALLLHPQLEPRPLLAQGAVVYETGDEADHVYFPHNGMFSLLAVMRDGKAIETATVGREGVVGAMAGLGLYRSLVRVVVQLPLTAS